MAEEVPEMNRPVSPKDVFQRSNMPSRWERITGVSPKTASDRKYLAFVAARYRGDKRLPHPDVLSTPSEVHTRQRAQYVGRATACVALVIVAVAWADHQPAVAAVAGVILIGALVAMALVTRSTEPAIRRFENLRSDCRRAESRLHADPLDPEDARTINEMINCDEGTLTYCAAKIASEIEQDTAWTSDVIDVVLIDLWEELAEVSASARQIAEDRTATEALELGRLRDAPDVRATIEEDIVQRKEGIARLAARVHAFADHRDHVHRTGMITLRERNSLNRILRQVSDEHATDRFK